jgi:hypothetical protein
VSVHILAEHQNVNLLSFTRKYLWLFLYVILNCFVLSFNGSSFHVHGSKWYVETIIIHTYITIKQYGNYLNILKLTEDTGFSYLVTETVKQLSHKLASLVWILALKVLVCIRGLHFRKKNLNMLLKAGPIE